MASSRDSFTHKWARTGPFNPTTPRKATTGWPRPLTPSQATTQPALLAEAVAGEEGVADGEEEDKDQMKIAPSNKPKPTQSIVRFTLITFPHFNHGQ